MRPKARRRCAYHEPRLVSPPICVLPHCCICALIALLSIWVALAADTDAPSTTTTSPTVAPSSTATPLTTTSPPASESPPPPQSTPNVSTPVGIDFQPPAGSDPVLVGVFAGIAGVLILGGGSFLYWRVIHAPSEEDAARRSNYSESVGGAEVALLPLFAEGGDSDDDEDLEEMLLQRQSTNPMVHVLVGDAPQASAEAFGGVDDGPQGESRKERRNREAAKKKHVAEDAVSHVDAPVGAPLAAIDDGAVAGEPFREEELDALLEG